MRQIVFLFSLFLLGCGNSGSSGNDDKKVLDQETTETPPEQTTTEFGISFNKINNKAKIFVDDSLIYESETIHTGYEVDYFIDISPYISIGAEIIKVELYNGVEPYNEQTDRKWEIMFDVVLDGEVVDFVNESKRDNTIGKVFEAEYVIDEWRF